MTNTHHQTARLSLLAAAFALLGSTAHAADVAVMIDRGAGTAPSTSDAPIIIDQRPIVVVDPAVVASTSQTAIVNPETGNIASVTTAQTVQTATINGVPVTISTPSNTDSTVIIERPNALVDQAPTTVVVDKTAPTTVQRSMTATPNGVITKTTITDPVTTTTIEPSGQTHTHTNLNKTTTITNHSTKARLSASTRVYNSTYRYNSRYRWNGHHWVKR
jgi:hypothetical protein